MASSAMILTSSGLEPSSKNDHPCSQDGQFAERRPGRSARGTGHKMMTWPPIWNGCGESAGSYVFMLCIPVEAATWTGLVLAAPLHLALEATARPRLWRGLPPQGSSNSKKVRLPSDRAAPVSRPRIWGSRR